jgi:type I restriction enzyme R subunit
MDTVTGTITSANFGFLKAYDVQLVRLGALAERYFKDDPNTCLIKLRQFGELLAQITAAKVGLFKSDEEGQAELLRRLKLEGVTPQEVKELFHHIRILGNRATHAQGGDHREALTALKMARELGVWFHRTFGPNRRFSAGPFVPPPDPTAVTVTMHEELERLRKALDESRSEAERARLAAEESIQARLSAAEDRTRKEAEERILWEELAQEADQARSALMRQLATLQAAARPQQIGVIIELAQQTAAEIDLDEAATRAIIDRRLRDRGWEADTETLSYGRGARPAVGRNMAIAEWPTENGLADYALFIGIRCLGMVEAKRRHKNVSAVIDQAEQYARGFKPRESIETAGGPWGEFYVPFAFSTNGRAYLKQIETASGIWFRDVRKPTNHRRALTDWPTPDGLRSMLEVDREEAHAKLKATPVEFGFPLRPYQRRAIEAIEAVLEQDQREILVAMATGTGKTKLAIALLYRLLQVKRFRRVCFVVDRNALGLQAEGEFRTTKVVSVRTFADIFGLKGMGDITPEPETKVHICTIQGLVKRVLHTVEPSEVPPIDQYGVTGVIEGKFTVSYN